MGTRVRFVPASAFAAAITVAVALAVSCGLLTAAPDQAQAASRATSASGGAKAYTLKVGKTYKRYDATGDGKADRILVKGIRSAGTSSGYYTRLKVYVNGRKRLTTVKHWDVRGAYSEVKLIRPKSGKPLLYVHYSTVNGYYAGGWVYRCAGSTYKCLLKTQKLVNAYAKSHPSAWRSFEYLKAVQGNKLKLTVGSMASAKTVTYTYRYKGGKLKRVA